jgi:rubrerythrin
MEPSQLKELLLQSLEHERGGVKIYQAALQCAVNEDLKEEWEKYLEQTQNHVRVLTEVCTTLRLDPPLGMKAVLPPPEERKHVKTAIGAARAEQTRTKM